jgi:hypothetical protein
MILFQFCINPEPLQLRKLSSSQTIRPLVSACNENGYFLFNHNSGAEGRGFESRYSELVVNNIYYITSKHHQGV